MKKALILLIVLGSAMGFGSSVGYAEAINGAVQADKQQENPGIVEASSLWIVVNMFTGRTSKQAVIVQETLERLGAGGRGIVLPYADITVENMRKLRPAFLALSPNGIPWCRYKGKNGRDL
ncbi:MAG: hypothetical protein ACP5U1_05355, partial [Desulfomonilaceae bacterium]